MKQLTGPARKRWLRLLFMFTYMVSYLTRINYGAVILEIGHDTGIASSLLAMAVTGSFITYGAGQLVSGWFGDRIQPKKLVFYGLVVTVCMNALIMLCKSPWQMTAVWCLNGFAQSFMWPPIVKLMTVLFSEDEYKRASVVVSWGSSFGTIFVYLMSPVWIAVAGWRMVFAVSAFLGLVMALIWKRFCPEIEAEKKDVKGQSRGTGLLKSPLLWAIMLAIVLQGALRDGVTTWMPSYVAQTFSLGNGVSILTGVVLPLFGILCFQAASSIYQKKPNDPLLCAAGIFLAGTASASALLLCSGKSAALCVLFMALLTGCMHGVNLILICMIPAFFKKSGNVSTVSGILNSCTYVGSAVSTYGIAKLSESAGWDATIFLWILIAAAVHSRLEEKVFSGRCVGIGIDMLCRV